MINTDALGEALGASLIFFLTTLGISGIVALALFILKNSGVYKISKNMNLSNPWICFIPFVSEFALGRIAEKYVKRDGKKSAKFSVWLLVLEIFAFLLAAVFLISSIVGIAEVVTNAQEAINADTELALSSFTALIPVLITYILLIACVIAYEVLYFVALWRVYAILDYGNATLFIVLSIFFSFVAPFFLFFIRNKEPKLTYEQRLNLEAVDFTNE